MYIPWLGYFHKMKSSDKFVILDDAEFSKNDWFNRNKIKTANGELWLTVPVSYKNNSSSLIKDIAIDNKQDWKKKHLNSIKQNYSKAKYYKDIINFLIDIYDREWVFLIDLNINLIRFIMDKLNINTEIVFASVLSVEKKSTERLIEICKILNADTYLSGVGAKNYLNEELFKLSGLKLEFQNCQHPEYQQIHGDFISHLSTLDLLFNCGPSESRKLIFNV